MGRSRHEGNDAGEVLVLVIGERVESLLGEGEDRFLESFLVFGLDGAILGGKGGLETSIGDRFPSVESINLGGAKTNIVSVRHKREGREGRGGKLTLLSATMKGVFPSRSSRNDSIVWGSRPCCRGWGYVRWQK